MKSVQNQTWLTHHPLKMMSPKFILVLLGLCLILHEVASSCGACNPSNCDVSIVKKIGIDRVHDSLDFVLISGSDILLIWIQEHSHGRMQLLREVHIRRRGRLWQFGKEVWTRPHVRPDHMFPGSRIRLLPRNLQELSVLWGRNLLQWCHCGQQIINCTS